MIVGPVTGRTGGTCPGALPAARPVTVATVPGVSGLALTSPLHHVYVSNFTLLAYRTATEP
jgi:hypothetical protein